MLEGCFCLFFCLLPCVVTWIVPNGNLSRFSWMGQIFFLLLTWSSYCECSWGYSPRSPLWCMGIPLVQLNLEIFVLWVLNLCRNKLGTRLSGQQISLYCTSWFLFYFWGVAVGSRASHGVRPPSSEVTRKFLALLWLRKVVGWKILFDF